MSRFFLELAYDGSAYNGWQTQPNGLGIQEVIEKQLFELYQKPVPITGAGRTDTGVHAKQQFAHFDLESPDQKFTPDELQYKLNRILPHDIAVLSIRPTTPEAHARFDAIKRTYHYFIHLNKDPFLRKYSTYIRFKPNFDLMQQAAGILPEYEDFTSFCKSNSASKTMICKISDAHWSQLDESSWVFIISADRFLRNMVRAIVGTMIEIGKEELSPEQFRTVIEEKNREAAGMSAEPEGLFLTEIEYPKEIFIPPDNQ